jgi:hypothetical protein
VSLPLWSWQRLTVVAMALGGRTSSSSVMQSLEVFNSMVTSSVTRVEGG